MDAKVGGKRRHLNHLDQHVYYNLFCLIKPTFISVLTLKICICKAVQLYFLEIRASLVWSQMQTLNEQTICFLAAMNKRN